MLDLPGGASICHSCYHQHVIAVYALSGLKVSESGEFTTASPPPLECSECHADIPTLAARNGNGDLSSVRLTIQWERGIYRFLCRECAGKMFPKRREFYKGTEFAERMRL